MSAAIQRMSAEEYAPIAGLKFIDVFGLHGLYEGLAFRSNLALVGPKGIGKTLSFQTFADKVKSPIITYDCSEDVRRPQLLGHHVLLAGESPFVLGPLTTAYEIANEVGQCILVLEEINGLSPQMQKVLNGLADFRRRIVVPECQKVFKLNDGAKLWFVGTMNTAVYGGVYSLNEDLKSRFRLLSLGYPKPAEEREILNGVLDAELLKKLGPKVIDQVLQLAIETRQKTLEYALSTRDVQQVLEDFSSIGPHKALRVLIGKFEDEDRSTVRARIKSIFSIKVEGFGLKSEDDS